MQGAEEGGTWRQASHPDPGRNCDSEGEMNAGWQTLSLVAVCQLPLRRE